jgi:hypothetical protein
MIYGPKINDLVRVHYKASVAKVSPHESKTGRIVRIGRGPGPKNVAVRMNETSELAVFPMGNLTRIGR